ncbi:helix-turn-helix transcriptional regulator [Microbacterium sp. GXF7504]
MATTSRLLTLLSLLQARRDWPGEALAERLGVSPRTVRRDVDRLRELGYAIDAAKGPAGGYRLAPGERLPPLLFDEEQVLALGVALRAATSTGAGTGEAALRALTVLRQVIPSRLRHRLDAVPVTVMSGGPGDGPLATTDPDVLVAVAAAVRAGETLRYDASGRDAGSAPPGTIEPHRLVQLHGRWYLVGWEPAAGDWRILRADRIVPRTPNGPRFARREVPGGDVAAFVSARFKGSDEGDRWPCVGTVVVHLPARRVRPFVGDGEVTELEGGRCVLRSGSWSWGALAAALCRFEAPIDVVEPAALVAAFSELAGRSAATASRGTVRNA